MSARLPILTYHVVGGGRSPLVTPPALFARQVAALARAGWRTLRVEEIAAHLRGGRPLPDKTLAITFDDGDESFAEYAWPLLREHGLGATLFVVAGRLGARAAWDGAWREEEGSGPARAGDDQRPARPGDGRRLLGAEALRRLAAEGVEIGAHSATHPRLPGLPSGRLAEETAGACRTLEEVVGQPVRVFAYPYGAHDAAAREAAGTVCAGACTTRLGFVRRGSDPLLLERIDAHYLRNAAVIARLDGAAARAYLALRAAARRARDRYG